MKLYQELKSHFYLPNAYNDWEHYRNTLTNYLIESVDEITLPLSFTENMDDMTQLPTLAILGAGACNDMDLKRIEPYFSKITLIDNDRTALQQAMKTYELNHSTTFKLCEQSINGITEETYENFCEELQFFIRCNEEPITADTFTAYAIALVDSYYRQAESTKLTLAKESYDYIWCFGLHSQLQSMFSYIFHTFCLHLNHGILQEHPCNEETFSNRLKTENQRFITTFHDMLLNATKKTLFLGNEQGSIEGAYQAICDIRSRELDLTEGVIMWPFHPAQNIKYEMLLQKVEK